MISHVLLRHLLLAAVIYVVSGTETCDGSTYRGCYNVAQHPGCCGEGYDYHVECKKCKAGKYKAWKDPGDGFFVHKDSGLTGHWCQDCPENTYQPKKGCRSCEACNGQIINDRKDCCEKSVRFERDGVCTKCGEYNNVDTGRLCMKKQETEYDLQNCYFSASILDSGSACKPGFTIGGKACRSNVRVTFSLIPSHWTQHMVKLEHADTKCTSVTRPTFNAAAGINCQGYPCEQQPSDSCFVNKNSFGLAICDIVDQCYSIHQMKGILEERYDQASLDSMWGPDVFKSKRQTLVVRMPSNEMLGLKMTIYPDGSCTSPQAAYNNHVKLKDKFEGEATFLDVDGAWGVRNLYFSVTSPYKCSCPPAQGGVSLNMDLGMFQTCRECKNGEKLASVRTNNPCNQKAKECRWCEANHHGSEDKSECIACIETNPDKPFRPNNPREDSCRACYWNEAWTGYVCRLLLNIKLVGVEIPQTFDQYRVAPLSAAERVPQGFYRYRNANETGIFDTYRIESCLKRARVCERYREYLHACTGDVSSNTIFYVQTADQSNTPVLWEQYVSASGVKGAVEIIREGTCQPCSMCSDGEYLDGCLHTEPSPPFSIWPGAQYGSQDQNKGTCRTCELPKLKTQYYDHPQQTLGCRDWPNTVVTKPYDIKPCVDVEFRRAMNVEASTVVLLVGCGEKDFSYWNVSGSDSVDSRSVPAKTQCRHGEDCYVPSSSSSSYELLKWSNYHRSTAEIPYCPRGWHVDAACVEKTLQEDPIGVSWNAQCCLKCGDCDFVYNKRGAGWSTCPGSTVTDTQLICTDTCDYGYYETVQQIDGRSVSTCTECETCQF